MLLATDVFLTQLINQWVYHVQVLQEVLQILQLLDFQFEGTQVLHSPKTEDTHQTLYFHHLQGLK